MKGIADFSNLTSSAASWMNNRTQVDSIGRYGRGHLQAWRHSLAELFLCWWPDTRTFPLLVAAVVSAHSRSPTNVSGMCSSSVYLAAAFRRLDVRRSKLACLNQCACWDAVPSGKRLSPEKGGPILLAVTEQLKAATRTTAAARWQALQDSKKRPSA